MLPNMAGALYPYAEDINFLLIDTRTVDGEVVETEILESEFAGVLQPIPPRKLMIKPEGQRSWRWFTLWTERVLRVDGIVKDIEKGNTYRVMSLTDWGNAGYFEYELAQGVPSE